MFHELFIKTILNANFYVNEELSVGDSHHRADDNKSLWRISDMKLFNKGLKLIKNKLVA